MTQPVKMTVEAGLAAEQALLAAVCAGDQEFGLLFWQPSDQALVMPRRLSRLPAFEAASQVSADYGWPVLLREPVANRCRSPALRSISPWSTLRRAVKAIKAASKPVTCAYAAPICDLLIELGGDASVGEIEGAFSTVVTTST